MINLGDILRYIIGGLITFALCFLLLTMPSCKSQQPLTLTRDSVRIEMRLDSVYIFKHDSIFRDRWRSGDTIYITTEKYRVQWRERLMQVHDTIQTQNVQQIAVKYVPAYYKNVSRGFWCLLAIILCFVGYKAVQLYIKVKSGGLL